MPKLTSGKVTKVVDGDTAHIKLSNGKTEKVRFIGVDTPESTIKKEPYGKEASNYTSKNLKNKKVYVEVGKDKRDHYGRLLAYIWTSKPTKISDKEIRKKMFNAKLLTGGYAEVMTIKPNSKYESYFKKFEKEARKNKKGLWKGKKTGSSPGDNQSKAIYVTKTGKKYHVDGCSSLSRSKIPISLADAKARGYEPCSVCDPPR